MFEQLRRVVMLHSNLSVSRFVTRSAADHHRPQLKKAAVLSPTSAISTGSAHPYI